MPFVEEHGEGAYRFSSTFARGARSYCALRKIRVVRSLRLPGVSSKGPLCLLHSIRADSKFFRGYVEDVKNGSSARSTSTKEKKNIAGMLQLLVLQVPMRGSACGRELF